MICTSISESNKIRLIERLSATGFAEVRLDALSPSADDVRDIFAGHPRLIATMRPGDYSAEHRLAILAAAIDAGAAYVDVDLDSPAILMDGILAQARKKSCKVIVSYHNYERTPGRGDLKSTLDRCFAAGADIAKIACRALSTKDAARILGLYDDERPIVAMAIGGMGRITRVAAPLLGSPFTYASQGAGAETADGQIDEVLLRRILEEIEDAGS